MPNESTNFKWLFGIEKISKKKPERQIEEISHTIFRYVKTILQKANSMDFAGLAAKNKFEQVLSDQKEKKILKNILKMKELNKSIKMIKRNDQLK